jgi:hypothetical protein
MAYPDKSIVILFETSFKKGDLNKRLPCLSLLISLNEKSNFVFNTSADKSSDFI